MIVKHRSFCDFVVDRATAERCLTETAEYSRWPECQGCSDLVCPLHVQPGTHNEEVGTCLCIDCGAEPQGSMEPEAEGGRVGDFLLDCWLTGWLVFLALILSLRGDRESVRVLLDTLREPRR